MTWLWHVTLQMSITQKLSDDQGLLNIPFSHLYEKVEENVISHNFYVIINDTMKQYVRLI